MIRTVLYSAVGLAILLPTSLLLGRGRGVVPGKSGMPANLNTGFPGCGNAGCHNPFANFNVIVDITTTTSITKGGGKVPVTVKVSGANQMSSRGGFSIEASSGTLAQQMNTNVRADTATNGRSVVTHSSSLSRQWTFDYTPSSTTGLVELFASGNAANGDGRTSGDAWGWYGVDSSQPGTPFRVFVNDTAVTAFGTSCEGGQVANSTFKFRPVLGIAKNAAVNSTFDSEIFNVNPGTASIGIFGLSNTMWGPFQLPLALAPFGGGSCFLRVSMDILAPTVTSGNGAGNGTGKHTWALPNIPGLKGQNIYLQEMTLDQQANGLGLVFSMGLRANIQ